MRWGVARAHEQPLGALRALWGGETCPRKASRVPESLYHGRPTNRGSAGRSSRFLGGSHRVAKRFNHEHSAAALSPAIHDEFVSIPGERINANAQDGRASDAAA